MMSPWKITSLVAAWAILAAFAPQDSLVEVPVEGFPEYLLGTSPGSYVPIPLDERPQYGWAELAQSWEPGQTVRVCFWGGSISARTRIVKVAEEWNQIGANITLDFGSRSDPRMCNASEFIEVRVGFLEPRYYSYVGRQSITDVPPPRPSINLYRFDYPTVSEDRFRYLVLHEFGHALGLMHEHQRAEDGCDKEFDWVAVNRSLTGAPYFWSEREITENLKPKPVHGRFTQTAFDANSVMHYTFPPSFYLERERSRCYVNQATVISEADKIAIRRLYSRSPDQRLAELADALDQAVSADERTTIAVAAISLNALAALRGQEQASGEARTFEAVADNNLVWSVNQILERAETERLPASQRVDLLNRYSVVLSTLASPRGAGAAFIEAEPQPVSADILGTALARAAFARETLRAE